MDSGWSYPDGAAVETTFTAKTSDVRCQRRETRGGSRVRLGTDSFPGAFIRYGCRVAKWTGAQIELRDQAS